MDGDFSRFTYAPRKGWRSVWMQQGRTLLDSDWNEQVALQEAALAATTRDILGDGGPAAELGFGLDVPECWHFDGVADAVFVEVSGPTTQVIEVRLDIEATGIGRVFTSADGTLELSLVEGGGVEVVQGGVRLRPDLVLTERSSFRLRFGHGPARLEIGGVGIDLGDLAAGAFHLGASPDAGGPSAAPVDPGSAPFRLFQLEVTTVAGRVFELFDGRACWSAATALAELHIVAGGGRGTTAPARRPHGILVGAGRYYAGGYAVENRAPCWLTDQPAPAPLPTRDGRYFAELRVRREQVSAIQDPDLLDPALHGADTTVRERLLWQVRTLPLADVAHRSEPARLSVRRVPGGARPDNHLYRVEVYTPATGGGHGRVTGDGTAVLCHLRADVGDLVAVAGDRLAVVTARTETDAGEPGDPAQAPPILLQFDRLVGQAGERVELLPSAGLAWSRRNGSVCLRLAGIENGDTTDVLVLGEPNGEGGDAIAVGDYLQIADDRTLDADRRGALYCVTGTPDATRLILDRRLSPDVANPPVGDLHPFVRRWDQRGSALVVGLVAGIPGRWLPLERGLEVRLEPGNLPTGASWTFATRVDWPEPDGPVAPNGVPIPRPPELPVLARTPLALLELRGGVWRVERDLRLAFPTLRDLVTEGLRGPVPGDLVVQGELLVGATTRVRGDVHAERLHGALADQVVGTAALQDASVTAAKLGLDVGFVPPSALLLADGHVPAGYQETGEALVLAASHSPWSTDATVDGTIAVVGHRLVRIGPAGDVSARDVHGGVWKEGPSLPEMLVAYALAVLGGELHLLGGRSRAGLETRTHLVLGAQGWEGRHPLPWAVSETGAAVIDGHLVVAGGQRALLGWLRYPTARVASWDPLRDRWTHLPALPRGVSAPAVATVAGRVHVAGGRTWGGRIVTDHIAWGPPERDWSARRDLPTPVRAAVAAGGDGMFWIVGGAGQPLGLRYDVANDAWTREPAPTGASGGGLWGGVLWVGGPLAHRRVVSRLRAIRYAGAAATQTASTPPPALSAGTPPPGSSPVLAQPAAAAAAAMPASTTPVTPALPALLPMAAPPSKLPGLGQIARVAAQLALGVGGGYALSLHPFGGCQSTSSAPEESAASATPEESAASATSGTGQGSTGTSGASAASATAGVPPGTTPAAATVAGPAGSDGWVRGIDVSVYQGRVAWADVASSGLDFAWIKTTEGEHETDSEFAANWQGAKQAGVRRGAYHFFDPKESGAQQARHFLATLGTDHGELPLALDLEITLGVDCKGLVSQATAFLAAVEQADARKPVLYADDAELQALECDRTALQLYPLWIAWWSTTAPKNLYGWTTWSFWQGSHQQVVSGIQGDVDGDWYHGTAAELENLGR
jgi:GH25 family lysozyme M1 (1,4-beta-N-acetylmuramidase)